MGDPLRTGRVEFLDRGSKLLALLDTGRAHIEVVAPAMAHKPLEKRGASGLAPLDFVFAQ